MVVARLVAGAATLLVLLLTPASAVLPNGCRVEDAGVYVAISSEAEYINNGSTTLRWFEVHWHDMLEVQVADWVGLWDKDPVVSLDSPLIQSSVSKPDGQVSTNVTWDGSLVPVTVEGIDDSCLPFWAGYVREDMLVYSSCLMLRPRWLESQKVDLRDTRLSHVVLPGAHDAGASRKIGLALVGDVVGRWTFTQDESLWEQLIFGVRYVDMRIAYYTETKEKLFVNHGQVPIAPLQNYIDDVISFMNQTDEVVVFDIHHLEHGFSGFPEHHAKLIALLEMSFGVWMAPRYLYPDPTMGELWDAGARLIVTYPGYEGSSSEYLWPSVYHLWGNVRTLSDLESYMYAEIPQQASRGSLWSAMTEFTPSALDVTTNSWGGLRGAAAITNTPVTQWFRQDWWNEVNIVSMDFILSSDVISVAIEANKRRVKCYSDKNDLSVRAKQGESRPAARKDVLVPDFGRSSEVRAWLTVSALASTSPEGQTTQRQLEMNWEVLEVMEGDWVGIFDKDPSGDWSDPIHPAVPWELFGYHLTNATLPHLHTNLQEASCLGWWVAYVRQDSPVAIDCFKVHPRWMSTLKEELGGVSLRNLVWPGTHDSGTYTPYSLITENSLMKYAITQDESIYNTMVLGNRYIDLRAGYFSGDLDEPYWLVHGLTAWRPFREALEQLREFVLATGEVVIAEVGGFTFFETSEHHTGCIALITEVVGEVMAANSYTWDAPIGDLLQSNASLIIVYNHHEADSNPLFWTGLGSRWANAQSLTALEDYMMNIFEVEGPPTAPWVMSGQLTPLAEDVIVDDLDGLRAMADEVNRNVTQWHRTRWWDQISIISCDFILSAGYVEVAIDVNLKRLAN